MFRSFVYVYARNRWARARRGEGWRVLCWENVPLPLYRADIGRPV